ncbi:MAG: restriction endonuclease [Blastocatellia bacterium]|nr:restriction endonuclease [Blastocatellia bacterium]
MITSQSVIILVSILAALLGSLISLYLTKRLFTKKRFTPENAIELLKAGRPEEWNEVRILNPGWSPDLHSEDFRNLVLPSANFQNANLDKALFNQALLDGCDFYGASLKFTNFENASLVGARFDMAILEHTNLKGALLDRASVEEAKFVETQIPEGTHLAQPGLFHPKILHKVQKDLSSLDWMNPWEFEEFVSYVFDSMGYKVIQSSKVLDSGFDLKIMRSDPIRGQETYIVECKKYKPGHLVGVSPLRVLYAKSIENDADHALLVTSSGFTREAVEFAKQIPGLELIDREALTRLVANLSMGIN